MIEDEENKYVAAISNQAIVLTIDLLLLLAR
jgi:hypothetical protein